jgi:hypothetical protein
MFYDPNPETNLRFGDIIGSFVLSSCSGYSPAQSKNPESLKVDLCFSKYVAVVTPCCTIQQRSGNT